MGRAMARTIFGPSTEWTPSLLAVAGLAISATMVPTPVIAQALLGTGALSAEVIGGTGGLVIDEEHARFSSPLVAPQRNIDATGQRCLSVRPASEQQTINTMIYNHILVLDNHCAQDIKIRACYYKTSSCQEIAASGHKRQRYVFGVFTAKDFRFSYREYVKPLN
jgi:hypothetical protein